VFEQALQLIAQLSASDCNPLIARLDSVDVDMDSLLAKYVRERGGSQRPKVQLQENWLLRCDRAVNDLFLSRR
jgi:hypothetical protein